MYCIFLLYWKWKKFLQVLNLRRSRCQLKFSSEKWFRMKSVCRFFFLFFLLSKMMTVMWWWWCRLLDLCTHGWGDIKVVMITKSERLWCKFVVFDGILLRNSWICQFFITFLTKIRVFLQGSVQVLKWILPA